MPLWDAIFRGPRSACLQDGIVVRPITATAANPVIRCRCGMPVSLSFCRRSFPCWKCRVKRHFAPTFSNSLSADPRQRWLSVARHRFAAEKEPVKSLFRRHLLGWGCADWFGGSLLAGSCCCGCFTSGGWTRYVWRSEWVKR